MGDRAYEVETSLNSGLSDSLSLAFERNLRGKDWAIDNPALLYDGEVESVNKGSDKRQLSTRNFDSDASLILSTNEDSESWLCESPLQPKPMDPPKRQAWPDNPPSSIPKSPRIRVAEEPSKTLSQAAEDVNGGSLKAHGRKPSKIPRVAMLSSTPRGTPKAKDAPVESALAAPKSRYGDSRGAAPKRQDSENSKPRNAAPVAAKKKTPERALPAWNTSAPSKPKAPTASPTPTPSAPGSRAPTRPSSATSTKSTASVRGAFGSGVGGRGAAAPGARGATSGRGRGRASADGGLPAVTKTTPAKKGPVTPLRATAPSQGGTRAPGGVARPTASSAARGGMSTPAATSRRSSRTGGRESEGGGQAAPLLTAISGPEEDLREYALAAEESLELEDDIGHPQQEAAFEEVEYEAPKPTVHTAAAPLADDRHIPPLHVPASPRLDTREDVPVAQAAVAPGSESAVPAVGESQAMGEGSVVVASPLERSSVAKAKTPRHSQDLGSLNTIPREEVVVAKARRSESGDAKGSAGEAGASEVGTTQPSRSKSTDVEKLAGQQGAAKVDTGDEGGQVTAGDKPQADVVGGEERAAVEEQPLKDPFAKKDKVGNSPRGQAQESSAPERPGVGRKKATDLPDAGFVAPAPAAKKGCCGCVVM